MSNTPRPEESTQPSPQLQPGIGPAEPARDTGASLEQHPRTTDAVPAGQPTGEPARPPGAKKTIDDLEPGEPPPESSAGS
ncbi:hypothetical protein [Roseateles sp. P5_E8]